MDASAAVAALLGGPSPAADVVARSLTRLSCWPSDAFASAYDELGRRGQLHHLLLNSQQPVDLLEHVIACGDGGGGGTRLGLLVGAVAGHGPAEVSVLTLMVELERRARTGPPRQACQCLAERLRAAGATDFARRLDARLRRERCCGELPVAELLGSLEGHLPEARDAHDRGVAGHAERQTALHELCRRCCSSGRATRLDGLSHATVMQMLRYACSDALCEHGAAPTAVRPYSALPPSAVAILHAFLCSAPCGRSGASAARVPAALCGCAGGKLLQRFVRGLAACVSAGWGRVREGPLHRVQPSADNRVSSEVDGMFRYASSVQVLLRTAEGLRVLSQVAEHGSDDCSAVRSSNREANFSWSCEEPKQVTAVSGLGDTQKAYRLAHFWLFLAAHANGARRSGSQWYAAVGDHFESSAGGTAEPAGARLVDTLHAILGLIQIGDESRGQTRGTKRDRTSCESESDHTSRGERINRNLPLVACLHALADAMKTHVHSLPGLHHEASQLCGALLDTFDGIARDTPQVNRLRRTRAAETRQREGPLVDMPAVYVDCGVAILQLVHSIYTFAEGCDEECRVLVRKHHSDLLLNRFGRLGGVLSMRIFAVVAVHAAESMVHTFDAHGASITTAARKPDGHGFVNVHANTDQLWRLFGEIVVQLKRWNESHGREETEALDTASLSSLLVMPAQKLMERSSEDDTSLEGPAHGLSSGWYSGVIGELLLCVKMDHRSENQDCDAFNAVVLDALTHLVSQPHRTALTTLWKCGDDAAAATLQAGASSQSEPASAAGQVLTTCANVMRLRCQSGSQSGAGSGTCSVSADQCCSGAVRVVLGLLKASAVVSSELESMQQMCIEAMVTDGRPSSYSSPVMSSLMDCGFRSTVVSLKTTADCARCLQYLVGMHDCLAVAMLADDMLFSDTLLAWGITRLETTRARNAANTHATEGQATSMDLSGVGDTRHEDLCDVVASVAGLLALCVERAGNRFWAKFSDDARLFTLLGCMLDIVLQQTQVCRGEEDTTTPARARAAQHTLRLVGNVADAVMFTSKLSIAEVPRRLEQLAARGDRVGLTSEGCARVGQMIRAIS